MLDIMDRRSSTLRVSLSANGEIPLLKSIAARKLSTCQAQNALEKGVMQMLQGQMTLDATAYPTHASSSSPTPPSVPTGSHQDTPLFAALSAWRFAGCASSSDHAATPPAVAGPSSSPSSAKSRWAQRRKSSLSLAISDRERDFHNRTARSATSASASAVHAAAIALADLSEDGFESALALSRQWRSSRVDSVESQVQVQHASQPMSPPRSHPPPRSVPVVCRESISWHDDEDDALSPSSVLSFELDELDNDAFGRSSSSSTAPQSARSASSDWGPVLDYSTLQPMRASRKASGWGPDSLARRLSSSLTFGQELYAPSTPHSRASSIASQHRGSVFLESVGGPARRRSSSFGGEGLRFRPSLVPRGSTSSGVYFHLDDEEVTPQQGRSETLTSVADELAWMSEQAMSDSGSPTTEASGMMLVSTSDHQQHTQYVFVSPPTH